jgi:hypothetical protein
MSQLDQDTKDLPEGNQLRFLTEILLSSWDDLLSDAFEGEKRFVVTRRAQMIVYKLYNKVNRSSNPTDPVTKKVCIAL